MTDEPTAAVPTSVSPPIVRVLPIFLSIAHYAYATVWFAFKALVAVMAPLRLLSPVILITLSPFTTILSVVLDMAVFTPVLAVQKAIALFYPLYLYLAVACIIGATVGILGRCISAGLIAIFVGSKDPAQPQKAQSLLAATRQLRQRRRGSLRIH